MKDVTKYKDKWVIVSTKDNSVLESDASFEKLYAKIDETRKDLLIKYITDPKATLSP